MGIYNSFILLLCFASLTTIEGEGRLVCNGEKSWIGELTAVIKKLEEPRLDLLDWVYVTLATSYNEGDRHCNFVTDAFPVNMKGTPISDFSLSAIPNSNQIIKTTFVNPSFDLEEILWSWRTDLETLTLTVKTNDPLDPSEKIEDIFVVDSTMCANYLPIQVHNPSNPKFKCIRVGTNPNTCERVFDISTAPKDFKLKMGIIQNDRCVVKSKDYYVKLGVIARGQVPQSEDSLSFHDIINTELKPRAWGWGYRTSRQQKSGVEPPSKSDKYTGFLQMILDYSMVENLGGESLEQLEEQEEQVQVQEKSHLEEEEEEEQVKSQLEEEEQQVQEEDNNEEIEEKKKQEIEINKLEEEQKDYEEDKFKEMSLEVYTAGNLASAMIVQSDTRIPAPPTPEQNKLEQKTSVLFVSKQKCENFNVAKDEKIILESAYEFGKSPRVAYCAELIPTSETKQSHLSGQVIQPCDYFRELFTKNKVESKGAMVKSLFVSLGQFAENVESCANARWEEGFGLRLKLDKFASKEGDAWKIATPVGSNARGKQGTWIWRYREDAFEISFTNDATNKPNAFNQKCGAGKDPTWDGGVILDQSQPKQDYSCLKISTSSDVCAHSIGLDDNEAGYQTFEVTLANKLGSQDTCEYASVSPFLVALTNEQYSPSEPNWKKVEVSGGLKTIESSWKWRTQDADVLNIVFEVQTDPKNPTKTEIIEFKGTKSCKPSHYPSLENVWEMRSVNRDSEYVCINFNPKIVFRTSFYKQTELFEYIIDLKNDPNFQIQDKNKEPIFGSWDKKISAIESQADTSKSDEQYRILLTNFKVGEAFHDVAGLDRNLLTLLSSGHLSHTTKQLPHHHPLIPTGKTIHAVGMQTRAIFFRNPRLNKYTGIFAQEKTPLIVRYSPSSLKTKAFLAGWAFKFFRNGLLESDDVVTYSSFVPQEHCHALKNPFTNAPGSVVESPSSKVKPQQKTFKDFLRNIFLEKERKLYPTTDLASVSEIGIRHLFLNDKDAWNWRNRDKTRQIIDIADPKRFLAAESLIFLPDTTTATKSAEAANIKTDETHDTKCKDFRENLMIKQLSSIAPGSMLFHVYAHTKSEPFTQQASNLLGTIVTEERFVMSWYGNTALHFKHERKFTSPQAVEKISGSETNPDRIPKIDGKLSSSGVIPPPPQHLTLSDGDRVGDGDGIGAKQGAEQGVKIKAAVPCPKDKKKKVEIITRKTDKVNKKTFLGRTERIKSKGQHALGTSG